DWMSSCSANRLGGQHEDQDMGSLLNWPEILAELVQSLDRRLGRNVLTTEDTVRYYFFLRLVEAGIKPGTMILERPHPRLERKQIDLTVVHPGGSWDFELKYHRPIPSGRNRPSTQLRGQIVSDLYKLALGDGKRKYLLYVADPKMAANWQRHARAMVSSSRPSTIQIDWNWLSQQPKTLQASVNAGIGFLPENVTCSVKTEASCDGRHLKGWLYEVSAGG
ncbi:hypothetical protein ACFLWA_12000, partial [Chloroflexota bacterium]